MSHVRKQYYSLYLNPSTKKINIASLTETGEECMKDNDYSDIWGDWSDEMSVEELSDHLKDILGELQNV